MPRIVGGSAKGRRIKSPSKRVRPATARARKALFDYLSDFIPGSTILDLFCGSGGLGLEALSRGGKSACFVDSAAKSINTAKQNAVLLGLRDQSTFICKDVFRFLRNYNDIVGHKFDLICAAPPYRIAQPQRILDTIAEAEVIDISGVVCLEYDRHTPMPKSNHFKLDRRKVYGETVVEVWDYEPCIKEDTNS